MGPWEAAGGSSYVYVVRVLRARLRRDKDHRWVWVLEPLESGYAPHIESDASYGTAKKARRKCDLAAARFFLVGRL